MNQTGISEIQTVRDSTGRFRVAPGNYLILPFVESCGALKLNEKLEFMIRIFAEDKTALYATKSALFDKVNQFNYENILKL